MRRSSVFRWVSRIAVLLGAATGAPVALAGGESASPPERAAEPSTAATTTTLAFRVAGMTCASCAERAEKALLDQVPGAAQAKVEIETGAARVRGSRPLSRAAVRRALAMLGFEARFPGEGPGASAPLPPRVRAGLDIRTISHGDAFDVKDHLAPGKVTIFDYYAEWCGPCRLLTPKLERLLLKDKRLALRKVDIVSWDSEAAHQASRELQLPGLPFTRVFDERGNLLGQVYGNDIGKIEVLIRRGNRGRPEGGR